MTEELEEYLLGHIDAEPELLRRINRTTNVTLINGRMCSGHLQGRLLRMLTTMIAPKLAIEIGTFTGYSALCIAEGLPEGSALHTFDINDEIEEIAAANFAESPYGRLITMHIGDALELVPQVAGAESVDMAFIDGNKRHYTEYYEMMLPLLRRGGYILADNTLWGGKVTDTTAHDAQTLGILRFNDHVAADERVERVILPLRDGLTIIRKR